MSAAETEPPGSRIQPPLLRERTGGPDSEEDQRHGPPTGHVLTKRGSVSGDTEGFGGKRQNQPGTASRMLPSLLQGQGPGTARWRFRARKLGSNTEFLEEQ